MSVSVAERRHDIGILRSVGATRSQVRLLFLGEATLMGAVGSLLGLPLGILFSYILLAGPIRQSLSGIYLPIIDSEIRVTLPLLAGAFVGGLLTSLLAAIVPASKAAAEEPADAVRRAPPLPGAFYRLLQLGGGTLLILAGVALVALRPLVPELQGAGTFSALGLIMVGAFLLMPALADALTRSAQWATRSWLPIESRLAADNLVRSPGRTGLVIAATAAGVALTVMTAGMIKSNEEAYRDWIDDTIKCDLFVTAGGAGTANAQSRPLPAEAGRKVIDRLPAGSKKVGMVYRYPEWGIPGRGGGEDDTIIFLTLIDARAHYEANAGREPDATRERWRRLADETGTALVSENFALMHNIKVGDSIRLESKGREYWRVIGTVVDYNWIRGSVWIDRLANREAFNADEVNAWEVYLPDEQRGEAARLRDELQRSELGARYNLTTLTREEIRDTYMRMINQVYGLAYTQQMLVGLVAVLGVVAALLISVLSRQRELGLLRAVGATRPQVMHTVLAEAVLIGLVGTVLGIVLGLPLEWYWVRIILFEESGFLFAVRVPWLETVVIALLAVVCATLAGLAPAAQAVRLRIADAIAYE